MEGERPTDFANRLEAGNAGIRYDAVCRSVLAEKRVLANIMRYCIEEYKGCSIEDIAAKYIEGEPEIGTAPVARGLSSTVIEGMDSSDKTPGESPVHYDIKFRSMLPGSNERVGLIINVEAQATPRTEYPLHARAAYYCARLLSAELGTILEKAEYEKLRRVYSIWVCQKPADGHGNSINEYRMTELPVAGTPYGNGAGHDLMRIVMLDLGDPSDVKGILRMLDVLFARAKRLSLARKKEVLETEFSIPMTEKFERGVSDMCNLSENLLEEGRQEGELTGKLKGQVEILKKFMKLSKCTAEQAVNLMEIPKENRPELLKALLS